MLSLEDIKPLHLADVTFPQGHPRSAQTGPVYAFLIMHPDGIVIVDTGMGDHPAINQLYRPVLRSLADALGETGVSRDDIRIVVNTHLHFDHCGGNQLFTGRPIVVQTKEYEASRTPLYTIPEWVDFPGAKFKLVQGEAEVLPGIRLVPTPGHTPGHQSVLVETDAGRIVIAGQAAETTDEFAGQPEAGAADSPEEYLASLRRLHELKPRRVLFSHDAKVWEAR